MLSKSAGDATAPGGAPTTEESNRAAIHLDRAIVVLLFALAFCAPHSIAATQLAWGLALFAWAIRCCLRPRPVLRRTPLDYPLLTFFALTVLSSFFSYDPETSIGKLRAASLFTIAYLVAENIRSARLAEKLALLLIASCLASAAFTLGERAWGRGVKVRGVAAQSPLHHAGVRESDTLLEIDGARVRDLNDIERALRNGGAAPARLQIYRFELFTDVEVPRRLSPGESAAARLGVEGWSRGRDWRAAGFYGHYTTFAEVLQLIGALVFGLLIAAEKKFSRTGLLLLLALGGVGAALFLTVTRASWLSFLISSAVVTLLGGTRRIIVAMILCVALVVPAALFLLQQKRNVGFFDRRDASITWRTTVYREGWSLLVSRPRHLLIGVGMDSIKRYWRQWDMFDGGKIPIGHMHSTPLQLALERGVPTLVAWLALLVAYAHMTLRWLWRRRKAPGSDADGWVARGLMLGALGGLVGFVSSGVVHYNLGDSEVAMVFYLIMGVALVIALQPENETAAPRRSPKAETGL